MGLDPDALLRASEVKAIADDKLQEINWMYENELRNTKKQAKEEIDKLIKIHKDQETKLLREKQKLNKEKNELQDENTKLNIEMKEMEKHLQDYMLKQEFFEREIKRYSILFKQVHDLTENAKILVDSYQKTENEVDNIKEIINLMVNFNTFFLLN